MILTYRYRVKNLSGFLNAQARAVNLVWNWANDTQREALRRGDRFRSYFDLSYLCAGSSVMLGIPADTILQTCKEYAKSRKQQGKPHLRYRGRRSLGWIPMKAGSLKVSGDDFIFNGHNFRVWKSRDIPEGAMIKDGSNFSQDAKGNWYLNIVLELPDVAQRPVNTAVGIDLGLKELAVLSDGTKIENPRHFRALEENLGKAQRAKKKKLARNIHQKIKNARKDHHHKVSRQIVDNYDFIAIGNVSPSRLIKTRMAKSVSDAGWATLKTMIAYKCDYAGATMIEVDESYTTQTCSACGALPEQRPRGIAGLGIREWTCACGVTHDRDVNAARNILALGYQSLVEGIAA